jgi:hypothetical protein
VIRRFNYTGRRRIPRSRIRIRVRDERDRRAFDAKLSLDGLQLPSRASVFVEAYHRAAYKRFDFGTVSHPRIPSDRFLDGIPVQSPLFRVKIVQREGGIGRIVAVAERVVPEQTEQNDADCTPLLPVEYVDLGDRVWALDLDSDWPRLHLNRRLDGVREAARGGHEFLSLVYPEVLRAVLTRVLDDGNADPDCDDDDWGTLWLRFACRDLGLPRPDGLDAQDAASWLEHAVNAFCVRSKVTRSFELMVSARGE